MAIDSAWTMVGRRLGDLDDDRSPLSWPPVLGVSEGIRVCGGMKHHKLVICRRCDALFVTRIGVIGCSCSGGLTEIDTPDKSAYIDAVCSFERIVCPLRNLIVKSCGRPLALHERWNWGPAEALLAAGVVRVVRVGDR